MVNKLTQKVYCFYYSSNEKDNEFVYQIDKSHNENEKEKILLKVEDNWDRRAMDG